MDKLHIKLISDNTIVPKEGQRDLLCSNKESLRCPSLRINELSPKKVEYLESFFRNIIRMEIEKYIKNNRR